MAEEIDPWASADVSDYEKFIKQFGMQPIGKHAKKFSDLAYLRRGIIFGHRDFNSIASAIEGKRNFAMMTGLMPSGKMHFGHKMVADEIIWFQKHGAETFVCAADVESYLMRDIPFEVARKTALDEYLLNYIALGLKAKNLTFWFQSDYRNEYYRLRDKASKRVTFNEMKAIYGKLTPGKIISALTQVADILHPQLDELGGPKPVVVPVGVDQDPHIRLTRDVASRLNAEREGGKEFKCIPPSATYHRFQQGLSGGKMSSSDPKSFIALSEEPKSARKKIMSAKTGGRETIEEQRRKGGEPGKCMIFELYKYHLIDEDRKLREIYEECKCGSLLCGEDKKNCADLTEKFLLNHSKKREKAGKKLSRYYSRD